MNKVSTRKSSLHGDTLVEVMFAVAIFGMVSVSAIAMMNKGVATAQGTLETSMARQEIDAQAEALRFIHNAYSMNASNEDDPYARLWKIITSGPNHLTLSTSQYDTFLNGSTTNYNGRPCAEIYNDNTAIIDGKSFIINPRRLNNSEIKNFNNDSDLKNAVFNIYNSDLAKPKLIPTQTYPRLTYSAADPNLADSSNSYNKTLYSAEGIWVTAVKSEKTDNTGNPIYYDFYIRTCWDSIGGQNSNTISTIVRLYNPATTSP